MTWKQAQWAALHDWFVSVQDMQGNSGYSVTVLERTEIAETERVFTDYKELRDWAGY